MKKSNWLDQQSMLRILMAACVIALAVAFSVARPQPASADNLTPPSVPAGLEVPAGNKLFLVGHAIGTQNYVCLPSSRTTSGFEWILFTPQATLFDDKNEQIITHFFSPNPDEPGVTVRPTWEDSRDTSKVWAASIASSIDSAFVAPGAIPWLKLQMVGTEDGPTGGDRLANTTFIQRLNTSGGNAPSTGCAGLGDVGRRAYVDYTADYYFYKSSGG